MRGGFDTDRLHRLSGLRWKSTRSQDRYRCDTHSTAFNGTESEQYSVLITETMVVDGVRYATAADVYRRVKITCPQGRAFAVVLYRGRRDQPRT